MKHETLPSKWQALAITGLAVILSMTTWFSATAVTPELVIAWSLSPDAASWMTNAVSLGFVVGALGSSLIALADRMSLTRLMCWASVLAAAFNAALLLEPGVYAAVFLRFLTGAALAAIYPPAMKFIATWFRTGRGLAMGAMVGALTLGKSMPHLVKAIGAGLDWQGTVATTSALCLASALIFALALREGPYPFARTTVDLRQFGAILKNKPVMLANCGYFGHMWELYAMWGWFAVASAASYGATMAANDADWLSKVTAFAAISAGGVACALAGLVADRIGKADIAIAAMVVSGTAAVATAFTFGGPVWLTFVVILIWGAAVVPDSAQFSALVADAAPPEQAGSLMTFQTALGFALTFATVQLTPVLAAAIGWPIVLALMALGPAFGIVAMMRLRALQSS